MAKRILCLHGYCMNAKSLHAKIGALRRALKTSAEFVCIDAPLIVPEEEARRFGQSDRDPAHVPRTWWNVEDGVYKGWKDSVALLMDTINDQGPFHGTCYLSTSLTLPTILYRHIGLLPRNHAGINNPGPVGKGLHSGIPVAVAAASGILHSDIREKVAGSLARRAL